MMHRIAWILVAAASASPALAAGRPENAVVVVNADSWASTRVANQYVHLRGIPASHVIHLSDLPSFERMPVDEFRQRILLPVLQAIDERGLAGQVDYVLYSADFPTAIDVSGDAGQESLPRVLTKVAAINGLTFLYRDVLAQDIRYLDLAANRYARTSGSSSRDSQPDEDQRRQFQERIDGTKQPAFAVQPPVPFSAAADWLADGSCGTPDQGRRYLLSTLLAYTSGRGNSVREALDSLRRSIAADGSRPGGTVYFLENGDIRSKTRAWGFRRAAEKLQELGVQAAVEPGILPIDKPDVAGATIGTAGFDWASAGSTILPGAICEHLTSCGGMLHEGDGQTPLTEFIRYGAAGASGTVTEPYAIQAKFPTPFVHWFYAQGASLAEAFYLSVSGPYQLLIVGDGLCQPWAQQLELKVDGLAAGATVQGTVELTPRPAPNGTFQPREYTLYVDGRRISTGEPGGSLCWDTTPAADGPHELCVVGLAADRLGLQAVAHLPVVVRKGLAELEVSSAAAAELSWDQPLDVDARLIGAREIVFRHHARDVARISGSQGRVRIDLRVLGQGPARIQPVGILEAGQTVWGRPVEVNVLPPPQLPATELPAGQSLATGFLVSAVDQTPQVVQRAEGDWLAKAGVTKDAAFLVQAWFEVPDDDVYQFQVRGDARTLTVDGVSQDWPRGKAWWFVPVPLARGLHCLRVEGIAGARPSLDIRFGGRGTQRLDGNRFRHPVAAAGGD